jgi:hypothetical protein
MVCRLSLVVAEELSAVPILRFAAANGGIAIRVTAARATPTQLTAG